MEQSKYNYSSKVPMPDFTNIAKQTMQTPNFYTPLHVTSNQSASIQGNTKNPLINNSIQNPMYLNYNMNTTQGMFLPYENSFVPTTIPFYPNTEYNQERDSERDVDYLKQLYPRTCKKLLEEIEEECDKLEYDGSCMFDEYPDRVCLERIIDRIYNRVKDKEEFKYSIELSKQSFDELEASEVNYQPQRCCNWLYDMIEIMFFHEIYNRRRRYRSRRRWF